MLFGGFGDLTSQTLAWPEPWVEERQRWSQRWSQSYQLRSSRAQALWAGQLVHVMSGGSWVLSQSPGVSGFTFSGQGPAQVDSGPVPDCGELAAWAFLSATCNTVQPAQPGLASLLF